MPFSFSFNYSFFIFVSQMSQYIGIPKSSILHFDELVYHYSYEISVSLEYSFHIYRFVFLTPSYFPEFFLKTVADVKFNIKYLVTKQYCFYAHCGKIKIFSNKNYTIFHKILNILRIVMQNKITQGETGTSTTVRLYYIKKF